MDEFEMRRKMVTHVVDKDGKHDIEAKNVPPEVDSLYEPGNALSTSSDNGTLVEDGQMSMFKGPEEEREQIQLLQNTLQFIKLGTKQGGPQEKLDKVVPMCTCCKLMKTEDGVAQDCEQMGDENNEEDECVPLVWVRTMVDSSRPDLATFELEKIYNDIESLREDGAALLIVSNEEGNLSFRLFKCPLPLAVDLDRGAKDKDKIGVGHEAGAAEDAQADLEPDKIAEPGEAQEDGGAQFQNAESEEADDESMEESSASESE